MAAKDRIIVALDVDTTDEAITLARQLAPFVGGFKIGLEFMTSMLVRLITLNEDEAHQELDKIRELFSLIEGQVFWDAKFHDIPNTIGGAAKQVSNMGVRLFNVHASAGVEGMRAATSWSHRGHPLVLAVTVLTSFEENRAHLVYGAPSKAKVLQFARDALMAGCGGIVCSPQELKLLAGAPELEGLIKVTPGIRSADDPPDDQKRTMTAGEASAAGARYVVIGRSITNAPDPVEAAKKIASEIEAVPVKK